jgi:hypothetical protein
MSDRPPPRLQRVTLHKFANVRVTGVLSADAHMTLTSGREAHQLLFLDFEPATGLPYHAAVDLGVDVTDHMAAQGMLPALRAGALVSVGGDALQLRTDHGHAVLRVVGARDVFVPS